MDEPVEPSIIGDSIHINRLPVSLFSSMKRSEIQSTIPEYVEHVMRI